MHYRWEMVDEWSSMSVGPRPRVAQVQSLGQEPTVNRHLKIKLYEVLGTAKYRNSMGYSTFDIKIRCIN